MRANHNVDTRRIHLYSARKKLFYQRMETWMTLLNEAEMLNEEGAKKTA